MGVLVFFWPLCVALSLSLSLLFVLFRFRFLAFVLLLFLFLTVLFWMSVLPLVRGAMMIGACAHVHPAPYCIISICCRASPISFGAVAVSLIFFCLAARRISASAHWHELHTSHALGMSHQVLE